MRSALLLLYKVEKQQQTVCFVLDLNWPTTHKQSPFIQTMVFVTSQVKIINNNHFVPKHNLILLLLCRLVKHKIDCLHAFIFLNFHKVFIFSRSVTTEGQATLFYHLLQQNYKHTHLTCVCYVLPSFAQVYWPNFAKSN